MLPHMLPTALAGSTHTCQPLALAQGRASEPAFMDMNLHAVRDRSSSPSVVLYQFDVTDPMNPLGLLMAYAEEKSVKPVVSDFDTFTVGSRGMAYQQPPPPEQVELIKWALDHTSDLLEGLTPDAHSKGWTANWLRVMKSAACGGFVTPELPEYGFGDPASCKLISNIVEETSVFGAVRHGAECFNYYL